MTAKSNETVNFDIATLDKLSEEQLSGLISNVMKDRKNASAVRSMVRSMVRSAAKSTQRAK
jgi:hypothetical protein